MEDDYEKIDFNEKSDITEDSRFLENLYSKRSFITDELRIVLIGKTGSGKSATGNTLTGQSSFISKLSGASITEQCKSVMFKRFERNIQVVDTPGLFDTRAKQEDIIKEIKQCVLMTSPGIHALILVSKVGRFTEEEKKTVEYFKKVFGDGLGKYLMIVFTGKDELDAEETTVENYVRTAPPSLQKLVAESSNRYVALNNRAPKEDKEAFVKNLLGQIEQMVAGNDGKCYTTAIFRKAEAIMKKREEEERKRLEEEKRKEREVIENSIKKKYDSVMKEQDKKMSSLKENLESINRMSKEEQQKHKADVDNLKKELEKADVERKQIEKDRREWEEKRRIEMEKKDDDRNKKMVMMMDKMEDDRKRREADMDKRMKEMDQERKRKEEEMIRREDERQRKEEEYRQQMFKLEQDKQEQLENVRQEQRENQERFERVIQEQARAMARSTPRPTPNPCSVM